MKIDLNTPLLDLDGTTIIKDENGKEIILGPLLAGYLIRHTEGDAMKFWEWAQKMHKGEVLDLDTTDQGTVREFVKQEKTLSNLVKAQLLVKLLKY